MEAPQDRVYAYTMTQYTVPSVCSRQSIFVLLALGTAWLCGCAHTSRATDRDVAAAIASRQQEALDHQQPATLEDPYTPDPQPDRASYERHPTTLPHDTPAGFEPRPPETSEAASTEQALNGEDDYLARVRAPARSREQVFTLTDSLTYAQQHRRAYQSAKEDLYLSTLALLLERHLWTPQVAGEFRSVYGNYGQIQDFDQAMRFVADLSVSQRLPYGGEVTAAMVSTLVRDIKRGITASETGEINLGLTIPLLRGAGRVAQEDQIQLERSLTYAVRTFERFRRQQLVSVARQYFSLLVSKQDVLNAANALERGQENLERARDMNKGGIVDILQVRRAESQLLDRQNGLATAIESFRAAADQFKITIGMPIAEPLERDDLETIESIEEAIAGGNYTFMRIPNAADDAERAIDVALRYRLDLLSVSDQIDDAKRGVAIAQNRLLPRLDWTSSLAFDTNPDHYRTMGFEHERATWRSEVVLAMDDRFSERNSYRASMIDVHRARRDYVDASEQIRADVLSAVNQIVLQRQLVSIQRKVLDVADERMRYANQMFKMGQLGNRDVVEAEDAVLAAQNALNRAKTARWNAILNFRLATGTLIVDESELQSGNAEPARPQAETQPTSPPQPEPNAQPATLPVVDQSNK